MVLDLVFFFGGGCDSLSQMVSHMTLSVGKTDEIFRYRGADEKEISANETLKVVARFYIHSRTAYL